MNDAQHTGPLASHTQTLTTERRLIRERALTVMLGISRLTIRRMCAAGTMPRPFKIGTRAVAWDLHDIEAFIEERKAVLQ